jgi:transcriptional regulator with XRE-family HTH domain
MSADPIQKLPAAFGKVLARFRIKRNLTQEEFAVAADLSGADDLIKFERGKRDPTLTEFFRIARAFGDHPGILFIDVIAAWRADPVGGELYKPRLSDFSKLYRLGYWHKTGDFREQERTYDSFAQAADIAARLNKQRRARGVKLLDTVCIYIRMGYVSLDWIHDVGADTKEVSP